MIEDLLVLAPKSGPLARMRHNTGQAMLLDFAADRWGRRLPLLAIVPKARQMGVSTWVQALLFVLCLINERLGKPFRVVTIAHIEHSAKAIFRMSRLFERKLPAEWRLPLDSSQQGQIEWAGGSSNTVMSAKLGDAGGKSVTLNGVHGSEVASWADLGQDPAHLWASTLGALAENEDTVVFLESTAKGRDPFFHGKIEDSLAGRSAYPVVFLPWFLDESYSMTWRHYCAMRPSWELAAKFVATPEELLMREYLARRLVGPGQEWAVHPHELTDEQLIWRRAKIEEVGLEHFRRYFPSTLEECFAATEYTLFSPATLDRMSTEWRVPTARGDVGEGSEWRPSPNGYVHRWHAPMQGHSYVIGADVSEGLAAGDYQAAYVIDRDTLDVVAAVHTKVDPDDFGVLLGKLGRYYNTAIVAVENNHSPSVVLNLRKSGYPAVYWHKDPDQVRGRPPKPGFNTNKRTRKVILDVLAATLRDGDLKFNDREFLTECGFFTWSERLATFAAPRGKNDDRVMAMAIAVYVIGRRDDEGRLKSGFGHTQAQPGKVADPGYEAWLLEQKREKARARRKREGDVGAGCQF